MKRFTLFVSALALLVCAPLRAAEKPKITSQDQIPRYNYEFKGAVTDVVTKDDVYRQLAPKVRADLEKLLADYDITDRTTLQGVYNALLMLDLNDGRFDAALQRIGKIRALEQKPAVKLVTGLMAEAYIAARRTEPKDDAALRAAFAKAYAEKVNALPWDVVSDVIQQAKGGAEVASGEMMLGGLGSQFQPGVDKSGALSGEVAQVLLGARANYTSWLPLKAERVAVLTAYVKAHKENKPDIWAARNFDLGANQSLTPVTVAIWDSGVDAPIFKGQMWTNPAEKTDGKDDDGDGFVDDVHGIAFTLYSDRTPELLFPLDADQRARFPQMRNNTKGYLDLQANIDSAEATALKRHIASLKRDEVKAFREDLGLFGNFTHGTHVAGIAAAGNPAVRLLAARITFDHRLIPDVPTREQAVKDAQAARDTVAYFKAHGVRVVNMSWGGSPKDVEAAFEVNGAGGTPEERKKLARELFLIGKDALVEAFKAAPEILFVCAAGNSNNDAAFDDLVPSGIDLPNILTVGAVDQAGEETSFTSFGPNVDVHANGFEVDSYIPGGERLKYSGTSMASPNVVNLAAKLLALDPSLTVEQTIMLIKLGAERTADGRRNLIHPQRSLALLKARLGK